MWASSERRRLREKPSVHERAREISIRLPFDDDAAVDAVVADGEMHHLDVEVIALSGEIEYRGVSFRKVDAKPAWPSVLRGES